MKKSVAVETKENYSSTEFESILAHTPRRMSDPENETSSSGAVTSEDVQRHITTVTGPLNQFLAYLCELMRDFKDAHTHNSHKETASSSAAGSSTGGTIRSDNLKTLQRAFELKISRSIKT